MARRVNSVELKRVCAVCERTLLVGERAVRYAPDGETFVDVCPLCQEIAVEEGWLKEGSPTTPIVEGEPRRRKFSLSALFDARRGEEPAVTPEPILRRLSEPEQAMVEAAELFNGSAFRRTIAGIAKSLGSPRVSILPLPGINVEVVVTIAWDISWYQYRVTPDSAQPVRLEERGYEITELDSLYKEWNGHLEPDGRIAPDFPRI
jgi:hypothetical protein